MNRTQPPDHPAVLPPKPPFADPRQEPRFEAACYPTANGTPAPPPDTPIPHQRVQLEFLAAYYHLNRAQHALAQARSRPPSPQRNTAERRALRQVEAALQHRDALEDFFAPQGVIAEPALHHGQVRDIRFTHGDVNTLGQLRSGGYLLAAYVSLRPDGGPRVQSLPIETARRLVRRSLPPPAP